MTTTINPTAESPLATHTPPAIVWGALTPLPEVIATVIVGYGAHANIGIARRQERSLSLVLAGHYIAKDLTLTSDGCPIVTRFDVRASEGEGHYHVTRIPNERTWCFHCDCPDTWIPCKHGYGAMLIQQALVLAHAHRLELDTYRTMLVAADHHMLYSLDERLALHVLLNTTVAYDVLSQEAARQFYGDGKPYASVCFSAFLDKVKWAHGAGYGGVLEGDAGCIQSALPGRPHLTVRWHLNQLRWYVVGADGAEDLQATDAVLYPEIPEWAIARWVIEEEEPFDVTGGFEPEEVEGHYAGS